MIQEQSKSVFCLVCDECGSTPAESFAETELDSIDAATSAGEDANWYQFPEPVQFRGKPVQHLCEDCGMAWSEMASDLASIVDENGPLVLAA